MRMFDTLVKFIVPAPTQLSIFVFSRPTKSDRVLSISQHAPRDNMSV